MRSDRHLQNPMFLVAKTEERLAPDHPLRAVKRQADEVLKAMSGDCAAAYHLLRRANLQRKQAPAQLPGPAASLPTQPRNRRGGDSPAF